MGAVTVQRDEWSCFDQTTTGSWRHLRDGVWGLSVGDGAEVRVEVLSFEHDVMEVSLEGVRQRWQVIRRGDTFYAHFGDSEAMVVLAARFPKPVSNEDPGSCVAPTPGVVIKVHVQVGDVVTAGQTLVTVEAMKMEHAIGSASDGEVTEVRVVPGQSVEEGALLVVIDAEDQDRGM